MKLFVPALFAFSEAYKYKDIHDIYYNGDQTLPAGDERGIQELFTITVLNYNGVGMASEIPFAINYIL